MNLSEIVRILSTFSFAIPLTVYVLMVGRKFPIQHHIIGCLLIASGLSDLITFTKLETSPIVYNCFNVLQLALITILYYQILFKKKAGELMILCSTIFLLILVHYLFRYDWNQNYFTLWSIASFIIALYALLYFFILPRMIIERYLDIHALSNMIFNVSFFFYGAVTFVIFIRAEEVFNSGDIEMARTFWSIHNYLNIMTSIGFALGFYYTGKREIYMTFDQLSKISKRQEGEK